jgi:hypothetical protein
MARLSPNNNCGIGIVPVTGACKLSLEILFSNVASKNIK